MEKALILDEPSLVNFVSKIENKNLKIEDLSVSPFSGKLSNDFKLNVKGQKKLIITGNVDNLASEPAFKKFTSFLYLNSLILHILIQLHS